MTHHQWPPTASTAELQRLLPQSPEAERGLLSALLQDPDAVGPLCLENGLAPAHFQLPVHREIYDEFFFLWLERMPCDLVSFTDYLRSGQKLDRLGGAALLTELYTYLPTTALARDHLGILKDKSHLREAIQIQNEGLTRCYEEQDQAGRILEETAARLGDLRDRACGQQRAGLPPLEDAATLLAAPPQQVPELIHGVLHRGMKLTLGGASKSNKTWCLVDMAVSVATGADWWGFPTERGRVVYLNFEVPNAFFIERLRTICRKKEVQPNARDLTIWNLRGHSAQLGQLAPQIIREVRRAGDIALIILDPLYKLMAGLDENSAGDLGEICNTLDRLATQTGAAIAYGSHFSKGNQAGKESIDRISGSGVQARDPDAILTLTRHEEEGAFTVESVLRNCVPIEPFVVRWDFPLMQREEMLDPRKLKKSKNGRETIYDLQDILQPLGKGAQVSTKEWFELVKAETGMSERTFFTQKKNAVSQKRVRIDQITGQWTLQ